VTLTGAVDSPTVRERAVRLAKETEGVRDVVDDLHVAATSGSLDNDHSIGDDIEHGAKETADAVKKGAEKTGEAAKETGEKIKDVFTDKDRDSDKDGK
jgi:BON domain-containing protein